MNCNNNLVIRVITMGVMMMTEISFRNKNNGNYQKEREI